jgi:PPOX class probable F420-dependent enzyme
MSQLLSELPLRALGGQPGFDPAEVPDFVDARRVAVLAYVRRDGRPNQTPIWYTMRDGRFHMTTTTASAKHRALERDPRVSLTIQDERPPYRAVIVDGEVSLTPLDPENDPTAGMSVRYFGRVGAAAYDDLTREHYEQSGLTLITLVPGELKGFDNRRVLSRAQRVFIDVRERLPIPRTWL